MKKLIAIFIVVTSLSAQYKSDFKDLIETTYLRKFDKNIVLKYLNSSSRDSISAALLSIANSNDNSFIKDIIHLNKEDLQLEKAFALGKLGQDSLSEQYFLENINNIPDDFSSQRIFYESFGNVISADNLNSLLQNINSIGVPFAIVNAVNKKVNFEKDSVNSYLISNLSSENSDQVFSTLYALYRIMPPVGSEKQFTNILKIKFSERDSEIKSYALGCLRRIKNFPYDKSLFEKLMTNNDWRIRTELARTAVYSDLFNEFINKYLKLLKDENPNVSRQAAISLKEIKRKFADKEKLDQVFDFNLTSNAFGEFAISYAHLFPSEAENIIEKYNSKLARVFIFQIIDYIKDSEKRFELLTEELPNSSSTDRIHLASSLLKLQDEYRRDEKYAKVMISLLRESNAPVISIVADGLEESFVTQHSSMIQEVVIDHLFSKINNADYVESIQSLYKLAEKVSPQFQSQAEEIILTSKVASIKQIVSDDVVKESDSLFDKIFIESFKYKEAIVTTNKGQFIFELNSEVAPISVGNICYLANKKYFDGIKFHRVVPDFVIQTGDSTSTGWGGPGYSITSEFSWNPFETGAVGMASAGRDTEGSQWFVMNNFYPHLDGNYTVFGKIIEGQDVVDKIDENDVVFSVRVK